jgi:acetyl-CoA carboxylase biotin carboxyl carrier protein
MKPDISYVEKLIKLVSESNVAEVEVHISPGKKVRVSKTGGQVVTTVGPVASVPAMAAPVHATQTVATPAALPTPTATETKESKPSRPSNLVPITAPMIGTFYRAPAPDAAPYVEKGDRIKPGTVVCIVEAMKFMNEIESDISGEVVDILVDNENPVEYGQELFLIKPD